MLYLEYSSTDWPYWRQHGQGANVYIRSWGKLCPAYVYQQPMLTTFRVTVTNSVGTQGTTSTVANGQHMRCSSNHTGQRAGGVVVLMTRGGIGCCTVTCSSETYRD